LSVFRFLFYKKNGDLGVLIWGLSFYKIFVHLFALSIFIIIKRGFISFANAFTGLVSFVLSYSFYLAGFGWFPPSLFSRYLVAEGWRGRWSGMAWWDGYLVYFLFLSDIFFSRWKRNYLMILALHTLTLTLTSLVAH